MKKLILILLMVGATAQVFAQDPKVEKLSEVIIAARNYKYLNKVDNSEAAIPIKFLERKVASYNVKTLDYYNDEFDYYTVSFFIPEGKIVAVYNKDGKIVQTIEKFQNVALPKTVLTEVAKRFPLWKVAKDVYLLNYSSTSNDEPKRRYKITLENGDKRLKIKVDADGNFL